MAIGFAAAVVVAAGSGCASTPRDNVANQAQDQCEAGVRAADAGRWEEAEFRWMKSIAIDSASACAHNNLGVFHERNGSWEDADEAYRRALEAATGTTRDLVLQNLQSFQDAREGSEAGESTSEQGAGEQPAVDAPRTLEVTVSVPEAEGRDLANFERILVGNFVVTTPDAPIAVNPAAVRYFRRRIVQRTFLQAVDLLTEPLRAETSDPFQDLDMWVERAELAEADVIFTGTIGLTVETTSRVVQEQIRTPDGRLTEVARFREMKAYAVDLDFVLLRGDDGTEILSGETEATREFAVDQGLSDDEAFVETLEELLPEILDAITPERTEQTRLLIY